MNKINSLLKNKTTWIGLVLGLVIAFGYGRFFSPVKSLAGKLPGSDAKTGN